MLRYISSLALLLVCQTSFAAQCSNGPLSGLFYQALNEDLNLSSDYWDDRFQLIHASGIENLYLQWVIYEEADFSQVSTSDGEPFLGTLFKLAEQYEINIYLGLAVDSQWFELSARGNARIEQYLNFNRNRSIALAETLSAQFSETRFAGWYLPEEINDLDWTDSASLDILKNHIQQQVAQLQQIRPDIPVVVSGFRGGTLAPEEYSEFWSAILTVPGVEFWDQRWHRNGAIGAGAKGLLSTLP